MLRMVKINLRGHAIYSIEEEENGTLALEGSALTYRNEDEIMQFAYIFRSGEYALFNWDENVESVVIEINE